VAHRGIAGGTAQGVHGDLELPLQLPGVDRVDPVLQVPLALEELLHLVRLHRLGEAFADGVELVEERLGPGHGLLYVPGHGLLRIELRLLG